MNMQYDAQIQRLCAVLVCVRIGGNKQNIKDNKKIWQKVKSEGWIV